MPAMAGNLCLNIGKFRREEVGKKPLLGTVSCLATPSTSSGQALRFFLPNRPGVKHDTADDLFLFWVDFIFFQKQPLFVPGLVPVAAPKMGLSDWPRPDCRPFGFASG